MEKPVIHYPKGKRPSKQVATMMAEDEVKDIDAIDTKVARQHSDSISEKDMESLTIESKAREAWDNDALSPEDLIKYYTTNKKIKLVSRNAPFNSRIQINDAARKDRKYEDSDYMKDSQLIARLRRGNSLIVSSIDLKLPQIIIARRGLPKFFDLRKEHLAVLNGKLSQGDLMKQGMSTSLEFKTIFSRVLPSIEMGHTFNLYRSHKANGENAQISFVEITNSTGAQPIVDIHLSKPKVEQYWVACSKNVTTIYQTQKDLDLYTNERYSYAVQIGRCWLEAVAKMPEDKVKLIKEVAKNHTLVGEYCGHAIRQHLVKYDKESIIFYAVVPKDCRVPCWPMKKTFDFFEEAALERVKLDIEKGISTIDQLSDAIAKMNSKVASSTVEEDGEGSVLYIERVNETTGEGEVLSLCKLKTMEYRFLRKAREKLKSAVKFSSNVAEKTLDIYVSECHNLIDDYPEEVKAKLPNISKYRALLEVAIRIARQYGILYNIIDLYFMNVIDLIKQCIKDNREPTKSEISQINSRKPTVTDFDEVESVNIVLIDIPGMIDVTALIDELKSHDYRIRFEYGDKRCAKKTFRFINISQDSINIKSMKPFTYLIVPSLESIEDTASLKKSCITRLSALFDSKPATDSDLDGYLKSSVNNISKHTNLDTSVDLSLMKISRIKDIDNKHVLRCSDGDWRKAVMAEVAKIEQYHSLNNDRRDSIDSDVDA